MPLGRSKTPPFPFDEDPVMKNVLIASCSLVLFGCLISTASAGEPAAISKSTLSNMGLGSMQMLSDADGMAVRGKGTFAGVWGSSTALWQASTATNNYEAGSNWVKAPALAKGESMSFAGNIDVSYLQDGMGNSQLSLNIIGAIAGGSAKASAF
jgi:hypothetical protein